LADIPNVKNLMKRTFRAFGRSRKKLPRNRSRHTACSFWRLICRAASMIAMCSPYRPQFQERI